MPYPLPSCAELLHVTTKWPAASIAIDSLFSADKSCAPAVCVLTRNSAPVARPRGSSSVLVTVTSAGLSVLYCVSLLLAGAVTIVYERLPSSSRSSTPLTVTDCGTSQLPGVKGSCDWTTAPSVESEAALPPATAAVG